MPRALRAAAMCDVSRNGTGVTPLSHISLSHTYRFCMSASTFSG